MSTTLRRVATRLLAWLCIAMALTGAASWSAPQTTITFWHAMHGVRGDVVRSLVARFNQQNPDVHVDEKFIGSTDRHYGNDYHALYQTILENLGRHQPPDVAQVYENWTTQLLEVNAVTPAQTFMGTDTKDADDLIAVFREANTFNGQLTTMPFNKSIVVLYYNRTLVPKPPTTLAELRSMAHGVATHHTGVWGLTFEPGVDIFGDMLYASGGTFFDNHDKATFAQSSGVAALSTLLAMTRTDRSALPSLDAQKLFTSGKAAMYVWTTTAQVDMRGHTQFPVGVATMPSGTTRAYQFAGTNLAILAPAERQQAAWRFVRFMTSTDSTIDLAIGTGYLPIRKSAIQSPRYQAFLSQNPGFRTGIEALPYARIQPRLAAWESVRGILDDAVYAALSGNQPPDAALTQAAAQTDDLIRKLLGK